MTIKKREGAEVGFPFEEIRGEDMPNKSCSIGEAIMAMKLGCSKEDAKNILTAGSRMGIKFLNLELTKELSEIVHHWNQDT